MTRPSQLDIDRYWLKYAYTIAARDSTDPSSQNAALIIDPTRMDRGYLLQEAVNRFPDGVTETLKRWGRPMKYDYVEHAERNAIYTAARFGTRTYGMTMYVPWYACTDCARAIIQAGITEVVGHQGVYDRTTDRWRDSIATALEMLDEAGVKHRRVDCEIGDVAVLFDGMQWRP